MQSGLTIYGDVMEVRSNKHNYNGDAGATLAYGVASVSVIYSYLAVEAFINYGLYLLWEDSRRRPDSNKGLIKEFYEKFGILDEFEDLKKFTEFKEIKNRIKLYEKYRGYPSLHKNEKELWLRLLNILDDSRHFIVHPIPTPERTNQIAKRIIKTHPPKFYSDTAEAVINYYYTSSGSEAPSWLSKNHLVRISEIDIPL